MSGTVTSGEEPYRSQKELENGRGSPVRLLGGRTAIFSENTEAGGGEIGGRAQLTINIERSSKPRGLSLIEDLLLRF
jgi:hypothetical protein